MRWTHLNTSNVTIQLFAITMYPVGIDLNTSNVTIQLEKFSCNFSTFAYLNTSNVTIQHGEITGIKKFNVFKYI